MHALLQQWDFPLAALVPIPVRLNIFPVSFPHQEISHPELPSMEVVLVELLCNNLIHIFTCHLRSLLFSNSAQLAQNLHKTCRPCLHNLYILQHWLLHFQLQSQDCILPIRSLKLVSAISVHLLYRNRKCAEYRILLVLVIIKRISLAVEHGCVHWDTCVYLVLFAIIVFVEILWYLLVIKDYFINAIVLNFQ